MRIGLKTLLALTTLVPILACDRGQITAPAPEEALLSVLGAAPTVSTDKADYAPGELVTITGTGWAGDPTVRLVLVEDPTVRGPRSWDVQVSEAGDFLDRSFTPETAHLGVHFTLTATGAATGRTASTTFTDGTITEVTIAVNAAGCGVPKTSFTIGETACASAAFTILGEGDETPTVIEWRRPNGTAAFSDPLAYDGDVGPRARSSSYAIPAGAPSGTWTVGICQGQLNCSSLAFIAEATFNVTSGEPAPQTITFTDLDQRVYGEDPFQLSATATSGLPVSFSSGDSEACSVSANTVTILAAGLCTIEASQAGNEQYAAATPVTLEITVNPRQVAVVADSKEKLQGEADPAFTYQIAPDAILPGDALTGELSRQAGETPGSYAIELGTLSAGLNYQILFTAGALTIHGTEPEPGSGEWVIEGFLSPVRMEGWNEAKAGSTIPLRFNVHLDGELVSAAEGISLSLVRIGCESGEAESELEIESTGETVLRRVGGRSGSYFIFNWKTPKEAGCYRVTVTAGEATASADFRLR